MTTKTVDITPHPRILQVLGEIEFKPWQCLAELIDNSIDQFIKQSRMGDLCDNPTIHVAFGKDTVVLKDNGSGMTINQLESAVKAGWTSNERFGNLGLYGVGFNIATARLGARTTIWTTSSGEESWYGLEIDLARMAEGSNYNLKVNERPKHDKSESGTEVRVSSIRSDWTNRLANRNWIKQNITKRLASIYSTMLDRKNPSPIGFSLYVNNVRVEAWKHCVWPEGAAVYRKSDGLVSPIEEIDITFGRKFLLLATGELLDDPGDQDPSDLLEVPERVYGWLGIQQYADESEYGLDILRNGRKIEVLSKDLFQWENEYGSLRTEYPIDDPRQRGRIVGELHLDHGYVHYTKHRFEREHASWGQLVQAVRHNEPLINRKKLGFEGSNDSPLGILFRTFRRNSPGSKQTWKDILFIKDNEKARKWASKWREGKKPYSESKFWLDALDAQLEADEASESETEKPVISEIEKTILGGGVEDGISGKDETNLREEIGPTLTPKAERQHLAELDFSVAGLPGSGTSYEFEVFKEALETTARVNEPPFGVQATARGVYEITLQTNHQTFLEGGTTKLEATLMAAAFVISTEEQARGHSDTTFGLAWADVTKRFGAQKSIQQDVLLAEIRALGEKFAQALATSVPHPESKRLLENLSPERKAEIELALAEAAEGVQHLEFLTLEDLQVLLEQDLESVVETGVFKAEWTPARLKDSATLLAEHRRRVGKELLNPIGELVRFSNALSSKPSRAQCQMARACLNRLGELTS